MAVFQTLLAIAYPALVYVGLTMMEPWKLALCIGGLLVLRLLVVAPRRLLAYAGTFWLPAACVALMVAVTGASNSPFALFLTPVVMNLGLLGVFAGSLLRGESTVERLAKIQVPDLSESELAYCRRVTLVWCGFFLLNGSAALGLAIWGDVAGWALYTGAVSYILMGTLFALEYVYRHWRFRRYVGAPTDPLLKWMFPPNDAAGTLSGVDPELVGERLGPGFIHQDLRVPEDLRVWPGHFPGYFIVPGVVQLRWVLLCAQRLAESPAEIESCEGLKFKSPLLPGQSFRLELESCDRDPHRFRFRLANGDDVFSVGALRLRAEAAP